jgi:ribosomal protein S18 acetylase RimI-like enzyme
MVEPIDRAPLDRQRSRVNEENLWEFCLALGRGGLVYDGEDVKWTCTQGPLFNRIFAASFDEANAAERVGEVVSEFLVRGTKVSWITGPSTRPANLGSLLEKCGFVHSLDWSVMDADLEDVTTDLVYPQGCRIEAVRDEVMLRDWAMTMSTGFGFSDEAREAAISHLSAIGFCQGSPLAHYIAYLNGVPAAVSTVFFGSRTVGVYFVTTVPSARRRGLGDAVTRRGLEDAKSRGYATAVLQASRMGEPMYRKMGFRRRSTMGLYFLDATSPH